MGPAFENAKSPAEEARERQERRFAAQRNIRKLQVGLGTAKRVTNAEKIEDAIAKSGVKSLRGLFDYRR